MNNPRQPRAEQKPRRERPKSRRGDEGNCSADLPRPAGEGGDPGLTIIGGSGYA